jgi:DNA repair exonuclease SbcCD ATPase subunit
VNRLSLALLGVFGLPLAIAAGGSEHQKLRVTNDFASPNEVVAYYAARDASGFVWSGLLDVERRAFTTWSEAPAQDTFYVAYPGSTIQQNHGEEEIKGFLVWDIREKDDWDVEFVEIPNLQPFITIPWKDTVEDTVKALQGSRTVLPGSRYRVASQTPLSPLLTRQIEHELKAVLKGEDVIFKAQGSLSFDTILSNGVHVKKASLRNDRNVIHGFYKQFLDLNPKKYGFTKDQWMEGLQLIDAYMDKLALAEPESARDVNWSLKSFEFDNLYRYGSGNKIDFDTMNGVVGVFGKNKTGKSSLVGALMYALFNGSDRDGVTKNGQVMNQTKKSCFARAVVNVNGTDYIIERTSTRAEAPKRGKKAQEEFDTEKTETKLTFTRVNPDGTKEELNGTSRDETDKTIRKLLGNSQDFLMTSVATQRRMESFIDEGATARKAILNRFLDLDIFEKLYGLVKEDVAALNAKTSNYTMGWEQTIKDNTQAITSGEKLILELDEQIATTRASLDELRLWIAQHESSDAAQATVQLLKVQQELFTLKRQQDRTDLDLDQLNAAMTGMVEEIQKLQKEESETDLLLLQANLDKMRSIQAALQETNNSFKDEERVLSAQEKSVRKLSLVPCGDQFPTCHYIAESHEDKRTIEAQKAKVASLGADLAKITAELKEIQAERYEEKMKRHFAVQQYIKELTKEQVEKNARKALLEKTKKDLTLRFQQAKAREEELSGLAENQDLEALKAKKAELQVNQNYVNSMERQRSEVLVQIGRAKAILEQIQKDKVECEVLLAKLKVLESVQAAFHKNGIPAIVLKTQLPAINAELDKLLGGLVDFKITFETEAGSNVMDIFIEDGHSRRILELGSGMEKMMASIAIRVALTNLSSLPKSDIFVIDEGFNALDEEHVGKCLELLQTLKGYFKSVLVISHMQRVKEAADNIIEVVSAGSDSRIET